MSATHSLARLRRGFDRRAVIFDDVRFLSDEISARMHDKLALIRTAPQRVLDIGCGSGAGMVSMRERFPRAQWLGLDLSSQMLTRASGQRGSGLTRLYRQLLGESSGPLLVQGDLAHLPFAAQSINLLWSNLVLHWAAAPHLVFPEWQRVLVSEGLLMFSTFGPETLKQLRMALKQAGGTPQIPNFVDMHDLGDMLVHSGFLTPVIDMEILTVTYPSPQALLADVRRLGLYPDINVFQGLRARPWLTRLTAALEMLRNDAGELPLTFEIVYGHAWKAAGAQSQTNASGYAVVRPDQIGRRGPPGR